MNVSSDASHEAQPEKNDPSGEALCDMFEVLQRDPYYNPNLPRERADLSVPTIQWLSLSAKRSCNAVATGDEARPSISDIFLDADPRAYIPEMFRFAQHDSAICEMNSSTACFVNDAN
jgi:hypothetical protein